MQRKELFVIQSKFFSIFFEKNVATIVAIQNVRILRGHLSDDTPILMYGQSVLLFKRLSEGKIFRKIIT